MSSDTIQDLLTTNREPSTFEIEDAARKYEELRQELHDIEKKRDEISVKLDGYRAVLSPMRRLSDDVLQEIFVWCRPSHRYPLLTDDREGPLLLTRVCRRWNDLALKCPRLWAQFTVPSINNGPHAVPSIVRHTISLINRWTERAKSLPIGVSFEDQFDRCIVSLFKGSRLWEESRRISSLSIACEKDHLPLFGRESPSFIELLNEVLSDSEKFPGLKRLALRLSPLCYDTPLTRRFADECTIFRQPHLKIVELPLSDGLPFSFLKSALPWSTLTSLDLLDSDPCRSRKFSLWEVLDILKCGTHLVELRARVDRLRPNEDTRAPSKVDNSTLQRLHLFLSTKLDRSDVHKFSSLLSLPSLPSLRMEWMKKLENDPDPIHIYPFLLEGIGKTLTSLTIKPSYPWSRSRRDLQQIAAFTPQLIQLRLEEPHRSRYEDTDHWFGYGTEEDVPGWIVNSNSHENQQYQEGDRFLAFITPGLTTDTPSSDSESYWPNLQYFKWEMETLSFTDDAIESFVRQRAHSNTPLRQVFIKLPRAAARDVLAPLEDLVLKGLCIRLEYQDDDGVRYDYSTDELDALINPYWRASPPPREGLVTDAFGW
ncbi:hydrophobin-251 [Coprinopsis cinerea AmutBmut pab1-1]|nr:hydrophobin-251 [Coprinopsis cinerea AmutBmut pab1-1]